MGVHPGVGVGRPPITIGGQTLKSAAGTRGGDGDEGGGGVLEYGGLSRILVTCGFTLWEISERLDA